MLSQEAIREVVGSTAYDSNGDKIGKVGQVFVDDRTGEPEFASVHTGLFGTKESFVPLEQASLQDGDLRVPYSKDQVKDAPNVDPEEGHLDEGQEQTLYAHYGLQSRHDTGTYTDRPAGGYSDPDSATTGRHVAMDAGHDTSEPTADDAMTRSEEQVEVGTTEQERGRARLPKYVTTEYETHTVPVRKERAVVETEPITDENRDRATDGPDISEDEHEVVLHEEKPVVQRTTEPVERVRLGTETEIEDQQVTEEVRKERIEVEGDTDISRR